MTCRAKRMIEDLPFRKSTTCLEQMVLSESRALYEFATRPGKGTEGKDLHDTACRLNRT